MRISLLSRLGVAPGKYRIVWRLRILPDSNICLEQPLQFRVEFQEPQPADANNQNNTPEFGPKLMDRDAVLNVYKGKDWFNYEAVTFNTLDSLRTYNVLTIMEEKTGNWKWGLMVKEILLIRIDADDSGQA
ncbi:hypothetical protein GPECTOR_37g143 [Gonium pectorale]|uniref:Uncharacterized protein n=1 Tax=Gonium pectorale TaxID=33097 RepID=A0A150GBD5_GONPE|nr:hypothetical protein GPECTOR_37g143 [Gonium pectorale]|eukprot:KXZ47138.1 hypothetical protein GPECTOR_37g143 [Gonium pectorale]